MPTEAYRLPNFLALLPEKPGGEINPHFKEVEAVFNAWVKKKLGGSSAAEVYSCESPLGCAVTYPLASYEQLKGIVDYTAAAFMLDDIFDHGRSPSEDHMVLVQLWMETLRDGSDAKSLQHPVLQMMRSELMLGIRTAVGTFHFPQFIAANEKMIMEMVKESHDRKVSPSETANLDIRSYIMQRRKTVGACVYLVFVRITGCLYIPDDVLAHPVVQEMEMATTDMLIIGNDIYSFKKEYNFDGGFGNILTVIERDPETAHLDFQGRLDYAEKLFKEALERLNGCRRELPSFGPEMDKYLALYGDGLIDVTAGNVQWSQVARRYSTFTSDEDRRNNVMRMALDGPSQGEKRNPGFLPWFVFFYLGKVFYFIFRAITPTTQGA